MESLELPRKKARVAPDRSARGGRVMQDARTDQLIFNVPALIAMISVAITLERGDVIITGTPGGVGAARKPPVYMQPGDTFEVEIEKLGVLTNSVQDD